MGIDSKTTNNGSQTDGQLKENESNSRVEGLAGFGKDYGANEARMALALADAGVGGGGGGTTGGTTSGGGTSASTISSGIDGSTDINTLLTGITGLNTDTDTIVSTLNTINSNGSTSSTRLQSLNTAIGGIGDASVGETSGGSLLSRMRGMHVDLANVDTEVTSIDGRIATTNTSLGTISTSVSDIETNSDAIVTDLAAIEVLVTTGNTNTGNIATDVGEIEALIGTSSDDAEDTTVLGKLTAIEEKLTKVVVESTYSDNVYSITNAPAEAQAANANVIEMTLQNTGEEVIRLRLGSNPTDTIHWVLPINAILVFCGLKARQSIHASVESTNNTGRLYITTTTTSVPLE